MLRLVFTEGRFICRCDFASREVPRKAGFHFDRESRSWYAETPREALKLREYADPSAKKILDRLMIQVSPWRDGLPFPLGENVLDHQTVAALFALSRNRSYLALEAGLGKTIIAALISNALQTFTVIVCPPSLALNTEAEFRRWSTWNPRIRRVDPKKDFPRDADVLIVPDSIVHRPQISEMIARSARLSAEIGADPLLIADEAHRYKNEKAIRTKTLLRLLKFFSRQVYLSGTPLLNRPLELYPLLSKVAPETIDFATLEEFGMRYCDGKLVEEKCPRCYGKTTKADGRRCSYCRGQGRFVNGYDFSGDSNLDELKGKLKPFMLRMRKREVLKDLPPKTEELVIIGEKPPKLIKMEAKLLRDHSPEDLVAGRVSSEHVATYRRELGLLKVKPSVEFIRSLLEDSDEAFLVFAFHKEVIADLSFRLKKFKPLVITGKTSKDERHATVKTFQRDPARRLFIGNYVAAGLGLTLTKASRIVFVEFSWVDAENDQASDRAHRIGQDKDVHVQYLVYENSIDRKVIESDLRKRNITNRI